MQFFVEKNRIFLNWKKSVMIMIILVMEQFPISISFGEIINILKSWKDKADCSTNIKKYNTKADLSC